MLGRLLASLSLTITTALPAMAANRFDWKALYRKCETDWVRYDADLKKLRASFQREFDAMSREEFLKRYMNDDRKIHFSRIHWPSMLSTKDSGWEIFRGCAERNLKVRNALSSANSSRKEKNEKINDLENCLHAVFAPRGPVPPPFDGLLACYRKHGNK